MRCESCGAQLPGGRTICEYCGWTWDRVISAPLAARGSEVFDRIKASAAWADRQSPARQARLPQMPMLATVAPVAFLVVFICVSGFMALMSLGMAGVFGAVGFSHGGALGGGIAIIPTLMSIVPVGFVVLGLLMMGKVRKRVSDFHRAPTLARAAVIAGKRVEVSGGGNNTSASTSYFVTAEFEDGRREEFAVLFPGLYGKVSEGDAGVLFVRSTYAVDFDRIVV